MKKERKFFAALIFLVMFLLMAFCYNALIQRMGEMSLFVYNRAHFDELIFQAGGLLRYSSDFLAQALYLPWLAALLAVGLLEGIYYLSIKIFNIPKGYSAFALLPVALVVAVLAGYGEAFQTLLQRNIFFTVPLGYFASLAFVYLFSKVGKIQLPYLLLAGFAAYWFFGVYGLFGIMLAVVWFFVNKCSVNKIALVSLSIILIIAAPYAFQRDWLAAISLTELFAYETLNVLPYILLAVVSLALLFVFHKIKDEKQNPHYALQSAIVAVSVAAVCLLSNMDSYVKVEAEMYSAFGKADYDAVYKIYNRYSKACDRANKRSYKTIAKTIGSMGSANNRDAALNEYYYTDFRTPTRAMIEFRMLALQKQGQLGDKLFDYSQASIPNNHLPLISTYGPTIYNNWGMFNSSYVWSNGFSIHGGWNYYSLKESALSMILNGNTQLAEKFLSILDDTLIYKKWAAEQRKYIQDPALLRQDYSKEYSLVCPREDMFYSDEGLMESKILEHFAILEQPLTEDMTPEYTQAALVWASLSKDPQAFWNAYENYVNVTKPNKLPKYIQQAAYMFATLYNQEYLSILPYDEDTISRYQSFDTFVRSSRGSVLELRNECSKHFTDTYFYYFFFVENNI